MKKLPVFVVVLLLSVVSFAQSPCGHYHGETYERSRGEEHVYVANDEQVQAIVSYIKTLSFDDKKMAAAKLCVRICPVPLSCLEKIVKEFAFDDNRLEFLKYAYTYSPYKRDYYVLGNSLTFSSNKDKFYDFLNHKNKH
ncbi:MAG: DUF4476 domain-containing protein [Bacteroidales bacterium]|nr:DUF4476 domain-containing protein [Bacteroidales bacterium]